jgi:hypothetical protein
MAVKKADQATTEEVQAAIKVLKSLRLENTYAFDEVVGQLPPALRPVGTVEGWISVNITGVELTDADQRKINALMKKNGPVLTYTRGELTWIIDPGNVWEEA